MVNVFFGQPTQEVSYASSHSPEANRPVDLLVSPPWYIFRQGHRRLTFWILWASELGLHFSKGDAYQPPSPALRNDCVFDTWEVGPVWSKSYRLRIWAWVLHQLSRLYSWVSPLPSLGVTYLLGGCEHLGKESCNVSIGEVRQPAHKHNARAHSPRRSGRRTGASTAKISSP